MQASARGSVLFGSTSKHFNCEDVHRKGEPELVIMGTVVSNTNHVNDFEQ